MTELLANVPLWAQGLGGGVFGLLIGSYIATLTLRWPKGVQALGGRSRCDGCGKALGPIELVPLLSYAALRGRCRACGAAIDPRHPAIELAAAAIGAAALLAVPGPAGLAGALFGWFLLALAILDFEHFWLPDALTLPLLALGLAASMLGDGPGFADRLIGAAAGYVSLALIAFLYRHVRGREGLGGGDPKLLAAIGAWLGWQALPFVLLGASGIGLLAVAIGWLRGRAPSAADRLPLGTLMAVAAWPLWLWPIL